MQCIYQISFWLFFKLSSSENENTGKYINLGVFFWIYSVFDKLMYIIFTSCIIWCLNTAVELCFLSTGRLDGPNISKSLNFGDKWGGGTLKSPLTRKYVSDYYITCFLQWWNGVGRLYKQWNNDNCVSFFFRNKNMVFREWKCRKIYPIEECFSGFIQILISLCTLLCLLVSFDA